MRRIMKVIANDLRSRSINRAVLQIGNELIWNVPPLGAKDAWIEAFLARYSVLKDGGLSRLDSYAIWLLEEVLKTTVLAEREAEAYRLVIVGIREGYDPEELAARATALLGNDCQIACWGAVYACQRQDAQKTVHMLTTSVSIVALSAGRTAHHQLANRRPQMRIKGRGIVSAEDSHIHAVRKAAEAAFWETCRAEFLDIAL